jgi:hypothetical protein
MSARHVFTSFLAISLLAFLAGCGSSSPRAVPPPTGGFVNGDLKGTYVFSTTGSDSSIGQFQTIVGAFVADGNGGIPSGTFDIAGLNLGVLPNNAITGGSTYRVGVDGRGQAFINSAAGSIEIDFVLTSSSHGLVTEFDGNGTGSGTLDLQGASVAQSSLTALTFNLSGVGTTTSFATIGNVALDATGTVTAGTQDFNNGGSPTTSSVSTSSFVTIGTGTAPGSAQLISSLGTFAFDVYVIDNTHVKFIENDATGFITSGDGFTSGTALPTSATLAFTLSGFDTSSLPMALAGTFPLDTASNVLGGGLEDFNDDGAVGQDTSFAGGFSPISGARSVLSLTSFVNGAANDVGGNYTFAAYPFVSNTLNGIYLLEIDGAGVSSGAAFVQTGTTLAASQGYGLNLSGTNTTNGPGAFFEEDDIAEFITTSSGFSGLADVNDGGSTSGTSPAQVSGSYAAGGTGRYTTTTTNFVNGNFYSVDGSTFLFLETDSNQIGIGTLGLQSTPAAPAASRSVIASIRRPVSPRLARQRKR